MSSTSQPSPVQAPQVLVVGAGPTGLVAALTLATNGVSVRVVEKNQASRIGQRGAGITARSMELFHFLGVADEISRGWINLPTVRLYKPQERRQALREFDMIPILDPMPDKPYPNYMALSQFRIRAILEAKLKERGFNIEWGVSLASLKDEGDAGVEAKLVLLGGEEETASFEYVIGADGAKGVSRKMLGLPFIGQTNIESFVVGDIEIEDLTMERWHQWGSGGDVVALRATEDQSIFNLIVGGANMERHSEITATVDSLKTYLKERTQQDLKIKRIVCIAPYVVNIRMTENLGKGRIWLAGDAAHIHSPFGGQGMNVGLQDAFNIGWKVPLVLKEQAPPSLLESYSEERIPVIAELLNLTTYFFKRVVKESTSEDSGWRRTEAIRQFGVNCRSSSIVIEEGTTEKRDPGSAYNPDISGLIYAGDRAPDATGLKRLDGTNTGTSLFEIFGPTHHTPIIFAKGIGKGLQETWSSLERYSKDLVRPIVVIPKGGASKETLDECKRYKAFEDTEGHADRQYLREGYNYETPIIIVRPDGTIGARLRGADSVDKYFSKIFV